MLRESGTEGCDGVATYCEEADEEEAETEREAGAEGCDGVATYGERADRRRRDHMRYSE